MRARQLERSRGDLSGRVRVAKFGVGDDKIADELYLSVLTRLPASDERGLVESYLKKNAGQREKAVGRLAWSLLASAEFGVNH